jgi:hypothetical protein
MNDTSRYGKPKKKRGKCAENQFLLRPLGRKLLIAVGKNRECVCLNRAVRNDCQSIKERINEEKEKKESTSNSHTPE